VRGMDISCDIFFEYISIAAVTAAQGSALTAGHFFQTPGMPAQKKVTKKACSYVRPAR
jgi:hypothetical protein